ncbi:MAG TPA: hypothetical protein DEA96_16545 [Leptospiraceae bacterium]|nr:hypothetical protein [Spirochaetaceae bacterium]HBS06580.1 hypothetical protein [Leptospiraceae bacterium]|tara:strand:+ start:40776 stop:41918 length:1143 start_codon:yes stop_codon:yes gene_type:complete
MDKSILFKVRPDGEKARWTNVARLVGLLGLLLVALARVLAAQDLEVVSMILSYPGMLLSLANLVWIYLLPSLFMLVLYSMSFSILAVVNFLHILILQRNNDELVYFMTKFLNMRTRVGLSILGLTNRVPHVDVYSSDPGTGFGLRFKVSREMPVRWILLRLAVLVAAGIVFFLVALGVRHIPYFGIVLGALAGLVVGALGIILLIIWLHNAITGKYLFTLVDLHLRLMRLDLTITSYFCFVTNELSEFKHCFRSVLEERVPENAGGTWMNANDSRRLDINLIALVVLIGSTQGLYLFIWLARTARVMGDDPFTIISVSILGSLLPLSVIFSRYYRRLEKKTGNDPSWILELLMIIPLINLVVGTFTIQYILNLGKKTAGT